MVRYSNKKDVKQQFDQRDFYVNVLRNVCNVALKTLAYEDGAYRADLAGNNGCSQSHFMRNLMIGASRLMDASCDDTRGLGILGLGQYYGEPMFIVSRVPQAYYCVENNSQAFFIDLNEILGNTDIIFSEVGDVSDLQVIYSRGERTPAKLDPHELESLQRAIVEKAYGILSSRSLDDEDTDVTDEGSGISAGFTPNGGMVLVISPGDGESVGSDRLAMMDITDRAIRDANVLTSHYPNGIGHRDVFADIPNIAYAGMDSVLISKCNAEALLKILDSAGKDMGPKTGLENIADANPESAHAIWRLRDSLVGYTYPVSE